MSKSIKTVNPLGDWEKLKFFQSGDWEKVHTQVDKSNTFPPRPDWYRALELTQPNDVKIVILGQDAYPSKGHANGLAFSVYPHVKPLPASLRNIFKEYQSDLDYPCPTSGDLSVWASRGILLLNTCLTVEEGKPGSHKDLGWERLAYEIFTKLNEADRPLAFILWGNDAQQFSARIDNPKHLVLKSAHPSPLAASKGFFGSKPFSKAAAHIGVDKSIWKLP